MVSGHGNSLLPNTESGELFPIEELRGLLGREVSIFYGRTSQNGRSEHEHEQAQLVLTFESASAEISWLNPDKKRQNQILRGHSFCLIPPRVPHTCRWAQNAELVILYLEPTLLREHVPEMPSDVVIADFRVLSRLDGLLWPLAEELRRLSVRTPAPSSGFVCALATLLAARTLERHFAQSSLPDKNENGLPPSVLIKVSEFIEKGMKEILNTRILAKHVGMSSEHFARLFKRTTGIPPVQYISKCRVQKALELLRTGEYRVADAACEVGFYDQSHLDRHCRKFFGFPPKIILKRSLKTS